MFLDEKTSIAWKEEEEEKEKFSGGEGGAEIGWRKGGRGLEERSGGDMLERGGMKGAIGMRGVEEGRRREDIERIGVEEEESWKDGWMKGGRGVEEDGRAMGEGGNRRVRGDGGMRRERVEPEEEEEEEEGIQ